jgi:hypothetical protein
MHTTQIFILRLFVDFDAPGILRGSVQTLTGKDAHSFASEQALGVLLRQMILEATKEKDSVPAEKQS